MLFRGHSYRTLDPKGRLVLPHEYRDTLAERSAGARFVLTTMDGCLVGYPMPDWEELEAAFAKLRNPSRKARDFRRLVLGGAEEMQLDPQERVRLSRAHMDYARLDRNVAIVGQASRFEIWDESTFKGLLQQNFDDVAEELSESGIDFSF